MNDDNILTLLLQKMMKKVKHVIYLLQICIIRIRSELTYRSIKKRFIWLLYHNKEIYFYINIFIFFLVVLSFWAILSIEINIIPFIQTSFSKEYCEKLNKALLNLSYSYFAGFIMYLLTVTIPNYLKRRKVKPMLEYFIYEYNDKLHNLYFHAFFDFNSSMMNVKDDLFLKKLMMRKKWERAHKNKMEEPIGIRIEKLKTFYEIKEALTNMLIPYSNVLTDKQLKLMLKIQAMKIDSYTSILVEPISEGNFSNLYRPALITMQLVNELKLTIPVRTQN